MAEEEESSWDQTIEEWLIAEGKCCAGALAQVTDGAFYAAAPVANDEGWGVVYADDHMEDIQVDDYRTEKMMINEASALPEALKTGKAPPCGLWLGGHKFTITRYDPDFEVGELTFQVLSAARPKKGVHLVSTGSQIVAGFYDEDKSQEKGNSKEATIAFAVYLKGIGY